MCVDRFLELAGLRYETGTGLELGKAAMRPVGGLDEFEGGWSSHGRRHVVLRSVRHRLLLVAQVRLKRQT